MSYHIRRRHREWQQAAFHLHATYFTCNTPQAQLQSQPLPSTSSGLQLLHLPKTLEKAWLHILTL